MKLINKFFFLGSLLTTSQLILADQIDWVDWISATTNEVIGKGTGKEIIDVRYNGSYVGVQTNGGTNYWNPSIPYTNNVVVDNEPPASDIIRITGGENAISHSIIFSKVVTNPMMAIVSLGTPSKSVSYEFDAPFNVLSQGEGFWGKGTLRKFDNNILSGQEGHGVIQFIGKFTSISWTVSNNENWHGFTIGIRTNTENEESVATPEVYINTNSQNIFKDEMLQVFFNTSVLAGMSEKYDVYFSINWDDITLYDNGIDLVSDKKPLFKNIVVPELSTWFEYQKLRYTFPEGVPQTDYVLGLHLVDSKDNVVFENFSSVNYFPEESVFTPLGESRKMSKAVSSINMQARSKNKKCHLGGIRTDIENTVATELDKATKRSMLALQMGSSFPLEGRLKSVYKGVKGSYNLLKKGKKVCDNVNNFETLFDNYDDNIDIYGLSSEQASNLFAIEMLSSALSIPQGGSVLYSGFDSNDLVNGVKDYYNALNKTASTIASIDNFATIKIKFEQPFHWFLVIPYSTDAVKLEVTVTPVFTYEDGYEFVSLKNVPKNFTDSNNIETKSKYIGKADSDRTSFGNIDYILKTALTRGLYLIKASTENGEEVYRDTIHVIREGQEHTMIIDR